MTNSHNKFNKGFTLLELLAVLIILSTLAAIAIPIFINKGDEASVQSDKQTREILMKQAQSYMWEKGISDSAKDILQDMINEAYIKELPKSPYNHINYIRRSYKVYAKESKPIVKLSEGVKTNTDVTPNVSYNKPELVQGMKPLIFDANINDFRAATAEEISNESWYNYNGDIGEGEGEANIDRETNERWANVKLADGSMFVWIPRYTYNILENGANSKIWIKYSNGIIDNTGINPANTTPDGYNGQSFKVHPAFKFGDVELTGIWVAKFEATAREGVDNDRTIDSNGDGKADDTILKHVKIIPGVPSWRYIKISNIFDVCYNMVSDSTYGLKNDRSIVDTHLMKNSEWGAVAYLTEAIRDGVEVRENNNSSYITGHGATDEESSLQLSTEEARAYTSADSMKASSTGNAYGIYDINGGAREYVAGYVANGHPNLQGNGMKLVSAKEKYKDVLTLTPPNIDAGASGDYLQTVNQTYGMALQEISNSYSGSNTFQSYSDAQSFPHSEWAFFVRGGYFSNTNGAGIFAYHGNIGFGVSCDSFRPVLINLE